MTDFKPFAAAVAAQFAAMSKHELFTTKIDGDAVYAAYLAAFPEGTNPIYRERTEHDCSCCRNFIKNIGNVVAIIEGEIVTVWDIKGKELDYCYEDVTLALSELIKATPIDTIFRSSEQSYGAESNKELVTAPVGHKTTVRVWNHFHGKVASRHYTKDVGTQRGVFTAARDVFKRGVTELTFSALDTVMQLIDDKQLYRGDEHRAAVVAFRALHNVYNSIQDPIQRDMYLAYNAMAPASRFRNTVIGSLVIDLSAGVPEEQAIKSFETKVAPQNYKRPTALVTEGMKKQAMETIQQLGLEDSLIRRLAKPSDVTINNVLWADNAVKPVMKEGIAGIMETITHTSNNAKRPGEITMGIEDFLETVLPKAKSIDMLVKNRHLTNFMAITAPNSANNGDLFKWANNFAWTYTGNIADSIKERVKAAGGATDAVLRVSLAWHNGDDLDIHAYEPNGEHIWFRTRGRKTADNLGMLDVDMNAGGPTNSKDPVENITWETPGDGVYKIDVNNFCLRNKSDTGYTLQVENNGVVHEYTSEQSPADDATHRALAITIKDRKIVDIKSAKNVIGGSFSQEKWGVGTETPVRVNMVMLSPNYWDENAVGNKHYMFILDGCKTDEPLRGILNEYLSSKLEAHRKVFEVLGDKTKCQPTDDQLAGLGFSSTKGDSITVNVTSDNGQRSYNIIF